MKTLQEVYNSFKDDGDNGGGDKGTVHSYIELYEAYLRPKIVDNKPLALTEIGMFKGHSMAMWSRYLPKNSYILGIDTVNRLQFDPKEYNFDFFIGDINSTDTLDYMLPFKYDVIIDDGSHILEEQLGTFEYLKDFLKDDGLYFVEDIDKIDETRFAFEDLGFVIHDLRKIKGRHDDVLAVYRDKN